MQTKTLKLIYFIIIALPLTQVIFYHSTSKRHFEDFSENFFSVLHLNIRSLNKNVESFKELCKLLNFKVSIICFERHGQMMKIYHKKSLFQLQCCPVCCIKIEKNRQSGGVAIFVLSHFPIQVALV